MTKSRIFGAIVGQSGTGKSYLVKNKIIPKIQGKKPLFILDKLDEYYPTGKNVMHFHSFLQFIKYIEQKPVLTNSDVFVFKINSDEFTVKMLHFIRALQSDIFVIVEEASDLFTDAEVYKAIKKPLKQLTMYGRHFRTNMLFTSQRPGDLAPYLRSQFQFIISFALSDRTDLSYIEQYETGTVEKLKKLQQFGYIKTGRDIPALIKKI